MVAAHKTISSRRLRPISFLLKVMPRWAFHVLEGDETRRSLWRRWWSKHSVGRQLEERSLYCVCDLPHSKITDLAVFSCVVPGQDLVHDDARRSNFTPGRVVSSQKEAPILSEDNVKCRFESRAVVFEQLWRSEGAPVPKRR